MKQEDLYNLPFWDEIERKILNGDPVLPIARDLIENGHIKDVKLATLNVNLSRVKKKLFGIPYSTSETRRRQYMLQKALSKFPRIRKDVMRVVNKLDVLGELIIMYGHQINRIVELVGIEEQAGSIPLEMTQKEMREARSTLELIYKIQVDLGIVEKRPEELLVRFDEKLEEIPAEKRQRVREVIRLMKIGDVFRLPEKSMKDNGDSD